MTYEFQNKPAQEITKTFISIIDSGGATSDIGKAFEALKAASPDIRRRVVDDLEDKMIESASLATAAWGMCNAFDEMSERFPGDFNAASSRDDETEKQEILKDLEVLKPVVQVLLQIAQIKGDNAQVWTKIFVKEYSMLSAQDKNSAVKLAECIGDVLYKAESAPPSAEKSLTEIMTGISIVLNSSGADAAIAELEKLKASDGYNYERIIDKFEESFVQSLEMSAAMAKSMSKEAMAPFATESFLKMVQAGLVLCDYIVQAKGETASALLKAYCDEVSRLSEEQYNDYYELATLPGKAVKAVEAKANPNKSALRKDKGSPGLSA